MSEDRHMKWIERCELKPGEMFAMECLSYGRGYRLEDIMVVLDEKHEVGFWRGNLYHYGHVGPSVKVLVL